MKVKVLQSFINKYTNEVYEVGDVLDLEEERVAEILSYTKSTLIKKLKEKKGSK